MNSKGHGLVTGLTKDYRLKKELKEHIKSEGLKLNSESSRKLAVAYKHLQSKKPSNSAAKMRIEGKLQVATGSMVFEKKYREEKNEE